MRRARRGRGGLDNLKCNDEKWRNLDLDKHPAVSPQTLEVSINLCVLPPQMSPLQRTTTLTKPKPQRSPSPDIIFFGSSTDRCRPAAAPMKGKGMQLGKKQNTRLYDALSNEIASVEEPAVATSLVAETSHTRVPSTSSTEGIQIALSENTTWKVNRDGGVEGLDVQGQLNLFIADGSMSRIQLGLNSSDSDGTVFKTHPNVDRNLFKDQHKIGLRDSSRPFPLNQQMSVLRWRLQSKGDSGKLPISGPTPLYLCADKSQHVAFPCGRWNYGRQYRV
jgi:hypothetical protein